MRPVTGTCKFCRQVVTFQWPDEREITPEQTANEAIRACDCESAQWWKDRDYKLTAVKERIENMLEDEDGHYAAKVFAEYAKDVYDGNIYKISIDTGTGIKAEMRRSKDNTIKITRKTVEVRDATV